MSSLSYLVSDSLVLASVGFGCYGAGMMASLSSELRPWHRYVA